LSPTGRHTSTRRRVIQRAAANRGRIITFLARSTSWSSSEVSKRSRLDSFRKRNQATGASGVQYSLLGEINGRQGNFEIATRPFHIREHRTASRAPLLPANTMTTSNGFLPFGTRVRSRRSWGIPTVMTRSATIPKRRCESPLLVRFTCQVLVVGWWIWRWYSGGSCVHWCLCLAVANGVRAWFRGAVRIVSFRPDHGVRPRPR